MSDDHSNDQGMTMPNLCVYYRAPLLLSVIATVAGWWIGAFSIGILSIGVASEGSEPSLFDDALAAVSVGFCFLAGPFAAFKYSLQLDLAEGRIQISRLFGWIRRSYALAPGRPGRRGRNFWGIETVNIQLAKGTSVEIEMWAVNYRQAVDVFCTA